MKFTFNGRKLEITDALREYTEKKLSKLDRFLYADADATVVCSKERGRYTTEVTVRAANMFFRAQDTATDIYATVDRVQEMIERQIRKNKTKLGKRIRQTAFEKDVPEEAVPEEEYNVIRQKHFKVESMDVDEAILQMNMLGHSFFTFKNAQDNDRFCVVYVRNDGGFGLIECE